MPLSEFILKAAKIHRKFYDYSLVDYKNNNTKVRIICPIHGVFEQTPNKHLSGQKCKKCRFSSGEKRILSILDDNKIKYEYQKSVTITKRKLRFDFFLPEFDLYIEYQGQQHFRGVSIFGGQTEFEKGIERDAIKRQYIKNTGSNLLEIPYWKFNDIEKILIKKIKNIRKGRQIFEAQNQMRMFV